MPAKPLLFSEGVCRQLKILSYHPEVTGHRGREIAVRSPSNDIIETNTTVQDQGNGSDQISNAQPQMTEKKELTPGRIKEDSLLLTKVNSSMETQGTISEQNREESRFTGSGSAGKPSAKDDSDKSGGTKGRARIWSILVRAILEQLLAVEVQEVPQ